MLYTLYPHETNIAIARPHAAQAVWVRRAACTIATEFLQEITAVPPGAKEGRLFEHVVQICSMLRLETPGIPPLIPVAVETLGAEDAANTRINIYFWSYAETLDPVRFEQRDFAYASKYHEEEEIVDTPPWLIEALNE